MNRESYYKTWVDQLPEGQRDRFHSLTQLAWYHSIDRTAELLEKSYIRKGVSSKNGQTMGREELMRATDELTRIEFPCDWQWIGMELSEARGEIKRAKSQGEQLRSIGQYHNDRILFMGLLSGAGLLNEYLSTEVGPLPEDLSEYNTDGLKDFDRIVEFMGRFGWVVLLMAMVEFKKYGSPMEREKKPLPFKDIFKPHLRDTIPNEVLRLLGPGQADAWQEGVNGKKWTYEKQKPLNAITVPFKILIDMGYIDPGDKKLKITAWLNEFGIDYKERTFDEPSQVKKHHDYFVYYLNKLQNK